MTAVVLDLGNDFQSWDETITTAKKMVCSVVESVQGAKEAMLPLPVRFWRTAAALKPLVIASNELNAKVREFCAQKEGNIAILRKALSPKQNAYDLSEAIDRLYVLAKKRGYTNRTLTAASLNRIKMYGEEILDSAETLELMLDPRVDEAFQAAREDYERGECVGMEIFS